MDRVFCYYVGKEEAFPQVGENAQILLICEEVESIPFSLLGDSRIHILAESASEDEIKSILWKLVFLEIDYPKNIPHAIFSRIEDLRAGIHLVASDYKDFGRKTLSNLFANFLEIHKAKVGIELFGKFKGIPALICGAGPSLESARVQIAEWENLACVFAGGTALDLLTRFSIHPHFGALLDPHALRGEEQMELPLFFQTRGKVTKRTHGCRLWIPDSEGDTLQRELEKELPPFEAGWNVATFCVTLAHALGCDPIIFVGLELSTPSENVYAEGFDEKIGGEFIEAKDVQGKRVYTKRDFLMAEKWLNAFADAHSETTFLNATEGGLPLSSIPRLSLSKIREKYRFKEKDLRGLIHMNLMELKQAPSAKDNIEKIQKSFRTCEQHVQRLLTLLQKNYDHMPGTTGEKALLEVELEDEVAYTKFFAPLWEIWKPLFLREAPAMDENLHRLLFLARVVDAARRV